MEPGPALMALLGCCPVPDHGNIGGPSMIVIAGASGFVGGHVVDSLLSDGIDLSCLARSETAANALVSKGCRVVRADITMPETLAGILHQGDFVIHLVGIIEEKGPATFQTVHVDGTRNLVAEAKRAGVRHFFYSQPWGHTEAHGPDT